MLVNPRQSGEWADAGFPTKLGEYFATKRPVITTKIGDLKDYFTDKKQAIFAEPNKPESIAEAILYLLRNNSESERIGEEGYKWAVRNLEYNNNAKRLIDFIKGSDINLSVIDGFRN